MNEKQKRQPTVTQEYMYEHYQDEINLVDLFGVLWKQRLLVVVITLLFVTLAVFYIFIEPPDYEITAQIAPGITDFEDNGNVIRNVTSSEIIAWFEEEAYTGLFDDKIKRLPEIKAKGITRTNNVKLIYYHESPSEGVNILNRIIHGLINGEANDFNKELNVRKTILKQKISTENQGISLFMIDKKRINSVDKEKIENGIINTNNKIKLLENKISILRDNIQDTELVLVNTKNRIENVSENTAEMMRLREQMVKDGSDKIALLMYSNIIQQNISFSNSLQRQILDLKNEMSSLEVEENSHLKQIDYLSTQIRDFILDRDNSLVLREDELGLSIEKSKIMIESLNIQLGNLSTIEINMPPMSSDKPEKPNKLLTVMLAFSFGLVAALVTAFIVEFWLSNKVRIKSQIHSSN